MFWTAGESLLPNPPLLLIYSVDNYQTKGTKLVETFRHGEDCLVQITVFSLLSCRNRNQIWCERSEPVSTVRLVDQRSKILTNHAWGYQNAAWKIKVWQGGIFEQCKNLHHILESTGWQGSHPAPPSIKILHLCLGGCCKVEGGGRWFRHLRFTFVFPSVLMATINSSDHVKHGVNPPPHNV